MVAIRYVGCCGVVMSGLEAKENEYEEKNKEQKKVRKGKDRRKK
jgi:hypothetical protein